MSSNFLEIQAKSKQYLMDTYARLPVAFVKGQGCFLWDTEGKKYLDLLSGVAVMTLGHGHPKIAELLKSCYERICHTSNIFYIESQASLAEKLVSLSFADKIFFCNSGTEANEAAIKLARKYGLKHKGEEAVEIITTENSFHGRTLGSMSATGQQRIREGFGPLLSGFKQVPFDDLEALEKAVTDKTVAIMLEPVQGEGGVCYPSGGYFKSVKILCEKHQILLILDEIQCGLGRTGTLFAYEHEEVTPDIMTLAKALGSGFPIGACLATEKVASVFSPGDHGSTFGGNFLATEVALKTLEILTQEGVIEHVKQTGKYFLNRLQALEKKWNCVEAVWGRGFMLAMKLSQEFPNILQAFLDEGLVLACAKGKILRILPPLVLTEAEVDEATRKMEKVLRNL